jgi:hypothetical protein
MRKRLLMTFLGILLMAVGLAFGYDQALAQAAKVNQDLTPGRNLQAAAQAEAYALRKKMGVMANTSPEERKAAAQRLIMTRAAMNAKNAQTAPAETEVTK